MIMMVGVAGRYRFVTTLKRLTREVPQVMQAFELQKVQPCKEVGYWGESMRVDVSSSLDMSVADPDEPGPC